MGNNNKELFKDQNDPAYVNNQLLLTPQSNKWAIKSPSLIALQGNNSESALNYHQISVSSQQPPLMPNGI